MKIIPYDADGEERMYCPSTNEVIIDPEECEINETADAVIGFWGSLEPAEPIITNDKLQEAWDTFLKTFIQDARKSRATNAGADNDISDSDDDDDDIDELELWEALKEFLKNFKSREWIVYETTMSSGPGADEMYFVVKADTILQEIEYEDDDEDEE